MPITQPCDGLEVEHEVGQEEQADDDQHFEVPRIFSGDNLARDDRGQQG